MAMHAGQFERVLQALKTNYERINPGNGFLRTVSKVYEAGPEPTPDDFVEGDVMMITDLTEDFTFQMAGQAESHLRYSVEGWIFSEDPDILRVGIRDLVSDFLTAHWSDLALRAADIANGGSGEQLLKLHRPVSAQRRYLSTEASFRAEVKGTFCWDTAIAP